MIPKVIHYCWFGKKTLPKTAVRCIDSWKKILPEYEIREWNEDNFDISSCAYVKEAYEAKKWAFVTDYVRLYVLVTYGGIYMDTDVEIIKPLDQFLEHQAFSGFQTDTEVPTGIMACEKEYPLFDKLLHDYDGRHFKNEDGSFDVKYTNVDAITASCVEKGLILNNEFQVIDGFALYPKDVFCAKDYKTRDVNITENTVSVHHFAGSWTNPEDKMEVRILEKTGRKNKKLGNVLAAPARGARRVRWSVESRVNRAKRRKNNEQ